MPVGAGAATAPCAVGASVPAASRRSRWSSVGMGLRSAKPHEKLSGWERCQRSLTIAARIGAANVGCCEKIQLRRRNRLRHHNKSCIFRGGAGGSACLARLRAIVSRLLRERFSAAYVGCFFDSAARIEERNIARGADLPKLFTGSYVERGKASQRLPGVFWIYTFCAAACLPARRPPTTHRAMPCSPNPPADSPAQ